MVETVLCFITTKVNQEIINRIDTNVHITFIECNSINTYLEKYAYDNDFYIVYDEITSNNNSFLFVNMYNQHTFRCDIDYLDEPLENLYYGVIDFDIYLDHDLKLTCKELLWTRLADNMGLSEGTKSIGQTKFESAYQCQGAANYQKDLPRSTPILLHYIN